jgi:CheY-like chemotaxis protein
VSGRKTRVLVVEDERVIAAGLRDMLNELGFDAYATAASSDDALARADEQAPDVVLMDVRLAGERDGIATAQLLRTRFPGLPVVYLTAHVDAETTARAKHTEPHAYLLKPVTSTAVQTAIELAVQRAAADREAAQRTSTLASTLTTIGDAVLADRAETIGKLGTRLAQQVNNPLSVIVMQAEVVRDGLRRVREQLAAAAADPAAADHALGAQQEIDRAVREIAKIMMDVRAFSEQRPGGGSADLRRAIDWAVRMTAHELREHARVITQVEVTRPVGLDEPRLGQMLVHVLTSAARAIEPGSAHRHDVTVTARPFDGSRAAIEIRDPGHGLTPAQLAHAFEPAGAESRAVGIELGLARARMIARAVGGDVELESNSADGTLVRLILPYAGSKPVEAPAAEPRARVLVIDDDDSYLRGVRRALRGHDVTCCALANDGLDAIARDTFDVIFLQMRMPEMSGIEVFERIRRDRPVAAPRVVFVATAPTSVAIDEFLASVPNHHVEKPMTPGSLRALVREFLTSP